MMKTYETENRLNESMGEKKQAFRIPRMMVIEDSGGKKTSFFPELTGQREGRSFYAESLPLSPGGQARFPLGFNEPEWIEGGQPAVNGPGSSAGGTCLPLFPILFKRISSAKNFIEDIGRRYEAAFREVGSLSGSFRSESHAFLHSDLLYLIAATDGNEDTVGHSQLVSRYALRLTKALGIEDRDFILNIERGALLHDIGKIGIPESVLRKPGPLTNAEKDIVKEHPLLGYAIIEGVEFLKQASKVVLFHHESFDGRGYPYGLAGEEIPLEARIFAVADTLDAITSDRPYRKGRGFREALDEIERGRGTQFDPAVLDAFLSVPEEDWQRIKTHSAGYLRMYTVH